MSKTPKVSVIMLTFNRETMVSGMIECILKQSMTDFEYIIIDNGSTDNSGKIADSYAEKDKRITVIHRERGNIGSGRNVGLDVAKGKYITFVDDDDSCTPDYLEFLFNLAEKNNAGAAICGASDKIFDKFNVMNSREAISTLLQRKKYNVAFPAKLFRRELFDKNRFLNTGKYDDIYLMPKILAEAKTIAYYGQPKYHFERHESNNSGWTQNHKLLEVNTLEEYLEVYRTRTEWLISLFPENIAEWQYYEWSFMISMVEKVTRLELMDCYLTRDRLIKQLANVRNEFLSCPWITDFELEWFDNYIQKKIKE